MYLQNVKNLSDSNNKLLEFLILCFGIQKTTTKRVFLTVFSKIIYIDLEV
jgi:hypothetical protein